MDTATMLLALSVPFMDVDEDTWETYCSPAAWYEVLDALDRVIDKTRSELNPDVRRALDYLPCFANHAAFASRAFTGGLPTSALPVESLYAQADAAITPVDAGANYLQQTAYYMRDLTKALGIVIPDDYRSMPDHLAIELTVGAVLLKSIDSPDASPEDLQVCREAARDYLANRFTWLDRYERHLSAISDVPAFYPALVAAVRVVTQALSVELA